MLHLNAEHDYCEHYQHDDQCDDDAHLTVVWYNNSLVAFTERLVPPCPYMVHQTICVWHQATTYPSRA